MTPEEQAVLDAAKKWVAKIPADSPVNMWADTEDYALIDAVRALEPPKSEDVPRLPRGAYLDKDGRLCMADDGGWLMYFGSLDSLSPAAATKYSPFTLLRPASEVVDADLARRLVDALQLLLDAAAVGNLPLPSTAHQAATALDEARAQIGDAS